MVSVVLRLVLAPALIAAASLVGRRWGPMISGWLIGLPFTSGPVAFLLALDYGVTFAATAARGTLTGTFSLIVFSLAYAWVARWRAWPWALVAGVGAFGVATVALQYLTLPLPWLIASVLLSMLIAITLMPRPTHAAGRPATTTPPRWDLPARMALAALFVALLTGSASALGPHLTGLLAPFPVYATILTVFAHQQQGDEAAAGSLRGLLYGMFAFISFFIVVAALLPQAGIATTFIVAILAALLAQGGSLALLWRRSRALGSITNRGAGGERAGG